MIREWHDLFIATAGSAAALTGLIFVGVSINLTRILASPKLPDRALIAIVFLLAILVLSILILIPGQSINVIGTEVLVTGMIVWVMTMRKDLSIYKNTDNKFKKLYLFNLGINQIATVPYVISGIYLLNGYDSGFYWLSAGFILCLIKAMADSWVLLIEINR